MDGQVEGRRQVGGRAWTSRWTTRVTPRDRCGRAGGRARTGRRTSVDKRVDSQGDRLDGCGQVGGQPGWTSVDGREDRIGQEGGRQRGWQPLIFPPSVIGLSTARSPSTRPNSRDSHLQTSSELETFCEDSINHTLGPLPGSPGHSPPGKPPVLSGVPPGHSSRGEPPAAATAGG